jgi:hypothetical protein
MAERINEMMIQTIVIKDKVTALLNSPFTDTALLVVLRA